MVDQENQSTIVCDNGSAVTKAGFSGQKAPPYVFPTVVGRSKRENYGCHGPNWKDFYVGDDAHARRGILRISYPIERGNITNWDDMERIWHYMFTDVMCAPSFPKNWYERVGWPNCVKKDQLPGASLPRNIMLTEAPLNPNQNREKLTQIMFEDFRVPTLYVALQPVLSLYSSGRTTGIVLEAGDGISHAVPIYEGYSMPHAILRANLGGRDLTYHMLKILMDTGKILTTAYEKEIVRTIKEKHCYVALDFEEEISGLPSVAEVPFELPDGTFINVGNQSFRCPEALFKPRHLGLAVPGFQEMVYQSINKCNGDVPRDLYSNIVLSGGTTMFEGLPDRLRKEVRSLVSTTNVKPKVFALPGRQNAA